MNMDLKNVLVEYKRNSQGHPIGVVIAIQRNIVGWSLCNKLDVYSKTKAFAYALGKAAVAGALNKKDRKEFYKECPNSVKDLVKKMRNRSKAYFKKEEKTDDND
jgi:hypothetical protein